MKELKAEWAMEAREASDSDNDVVHWGRSAPGATGAAGAAESCVTCHLRNRSTRASLTFPIVTFHLHRR
jgi:hypothetical protein